MIQFVVLLIAVTSHTLLNWHYHLRMEGLPVLIPMGFGVISAIIGKSRLIVFLTTFLGTSGGFIAWKIQKGRYTSTDPWWIGLLIGIVLSIPGLLIHYIRCKKMKTTKSSL